MELDALSEAVVNEKNKNLVLLSGLGGIGKSTLCARWFNGVALSHFDHIAWVSCRDGIETGLLGSQIYQRLKIEDDPAVLIERFGHFTGKILCVLDDIRDPDDHLLHQFKNIGHAGFTLIATSRQKLQGFVAQPVGFLSKEHCYKLFQCFYKTEERELVEVLIAKAGQHTLTIELIAKTMDAGELKPSEMLEKLKQHGFDLSHALDEEADYLKDGKDHTEHLTDALRSLFNIAELDERYQHILFLLGHFNGADFDKKRVKEWFQLESLKELNQLEKLGWIARTEDRRYNLHPVVSDVARQLFNTGNESGSLISVIQEKTLDAYLKQIIASLSDEHFNSRFPGDFHLLQPLQQFFTYIFHKSSTFALALHQTAYRFQYQGSYLHALPLYERALVIREAVLGPEHPDVATTLNNLGGLHRAMGAYEKALPLYERALVISEAVLGPEHPSVATTLNNLGGLHRAMGAYEKALPLYERALVISEAVLGPEHPSVATTLNNLGGLYESMGAYEKALPLYERALVISEAVLGPEHPDVATTLNNLGGLHRAMGAYDRALPLYKRALAIMKIKLGQEHPHTKTVAGNFLMVIQSFVEKLKSGEVASDFDVQSLESDVLLAWQIINVEQSV
ncbi:tetratricopeptide repeat protein [Paraneptunicella aestuarii]|uniref:tetratricopeptide repeat protein n=1 Tax=Paraneptunicella aestuarii TaxID=2831148 RepID=UPI001E39B647|nr:tetratricopeptide repeat protein [Paraneptunicella aestuarii]UAA38412.1 tetratricopeptide repeat protein [Paraneptunicella aestuarii]